MDRTLEEIVADMKELEEKLLKQTPQDLHACRDIFLRTTMNMLDLAAQVDALRKDVDTPPPATE